jgi:RNA polymerase sigma-70 factor (ECF subfamily)
VHIDPTVLAARAGDPDAFAALYDAHAPRVFALCVRMAGDRALAAELLQDVFVRLWEQLGSFRGDSSFGTWLHRLAVNVVLVHARGASRRRARVAGEADLPGDLPDPGGQAPDVALRMDLERAIAALPTQARAVFVLHDVEGVPHEEISRQLGIAPGTARAHLFRARRLLREMLR